MADEFCKGSHYQASRNSLMLIVIKAREGNMMITEIYLNSDWLVLSVSPSLSSERGRWWTWWM